MGTNGEEAMWLIIFHSTFDIGEYANFLNFNCSGSRTGHIHHHDVRVAEHHVATLAGHTQEVCGLKWAPDGRYLASGGNDNLVNIWSVAQGDNWSLRPVQTFTQHQGAVKVSTYLYLESRHTSWHKIIWYKAQLMVIWVTL